MTASIDGGPDAVMRKLLMIAPRFWAKVAVYDIRASSVCWPWLGSPQGNGYGRFKISDAEGQEQAHRVAWAYANGRLPDPDKYICHTCDNPICCNPAHLFEGTPTQNFYDMVDKGRGTFRRGYCRKGHALVEGNIVQKRNGDRRCRTCVQAYQRKQYRRRKALGDQLNQEGE